jgi:eukaryotic-like serine/threonine-protein kinase
MSYRRAFLLLIFMILVGAAAAYIMTVDTIDAPAWAVAVASVIVVGGAILALFPNLHDSTQFIQGIFSSDEADKAEQQAYSADPARRQRNRVNLLANLHSTWIKGALENALHKAVIIELGLTIEPDAVSRADHPWRLTLQQPDTELLIPTEKSIDQIFDEHGRNLLILGDPGSGKTITLLQLAAVFIKRAQQEQEQPIPVVLNLSSWAQQQMPLEQWIAEEMYVQYQMPRPLAFAWLGNDELLLLLDGLDEVEEQFGNDCIVAINKFKEKHGAEVVVCSREEDYKKLSKRLNLSTAVCLQPLELPQMQGYLAQFGDIVKGFREALADDPQLQALVASPLMLSLVPLTYANLSAAEIPREATVAAAQQTLLNRYVRQTFYRRRWPVAVDYSVKQAAIWLHNLAIGMSQHKQTVFYIERLQGTWLPTEKARRRFSWSVSLIIGLLMGLIGWLLTGLIWGLHTGLIWGLLIGLIGWLLTGLMGTSERIGLAENLVWKRPSRKRFSHAFIGGSLLGILPLLSFGIAAEVGWHGLGFLLTPIALTILVGWPLWLLYRRLEWPIEYLIAGLFWGLFWGLVIGFVLGLIIGLGEGLFYGLTGGLSSGLIWGLVIGFIIEGFQYQEIRERSLPNQSIRQSTRNAVGFLLAGVLGGFVFALALWYLDGHLWGMYNTAYFRIGGGLQGALIVGISSGVSFALGSSFFYGLNTVLTHYLLRWLIHRHQLLPAFPRDRHLIDFLDHMASHILLRRVGGGWQFVHRYLLEYFALLTPAELKQLSEKPQ